MSKQEVVNLGLLRIRADLGKKVEVLLEDPTKPGRKKYGSLKRYMEGLIARDLQERGALAETSIKEVLESLLEEETNEQE